MARRNRKLRHQMNLLLQEIWNCLRHSSARCQGEIDSPSGCIQLEKRILLSATPMAIAEAALPAETADDAASDAAITTEPAAESGVDQDTADRNSKSATDDVSELVVIDGTVSDADSLIDDIVNQGDSAMEVIVLDADRDGIEQITELLARYDDLSALHLVSHSLNNGLLLGDSQLTMSSLGGYAPLIGQWSEALSDSADILIYGCDLAATSEGQSLLQGLQLLTGSDVAASTNDTGHASYSADWILEYSVGAIDSNVAFSTDLQVNWQNKLATVTVTQTADLVNGDTASLAALIADDGGDGISLREAILAVNAGGGGDTLLLGSGTYTLSLTGADEDLSVSGDLDLLRDITIRGAGVGSTTIDASGLGASPERVFEVHSGTTLTVEDLTIRGGDAGAQNGGGVFVDGTLIANRISVQDNAAGFGAGIYATGTVSLTDVAMSSNAATIHGGGIALEGSGAATIIGSEISHNSGSLGGGIYHNGSLLSVTNATISSNIAINGGGGIYSRGAATISFSTIAYNDGDNGVTTNDIAGIRTAGAGSVTLANSILHNPLGSNSSSGFTDNGNNIVTDASAGFGTNADPLLGFLQYNGGITRTHSITAMSPAYNAGNPVGAPTVDQRSTARDASPDIGAYEVSLITSSPIGTLTDADASANEVAENPTNGTTVGITASATDPDGGDSVSYSLLDDAGGRFAIDANSGVVTVADGTRLDRESAASHSITVQALSTDTSATIEMFSIALLDVNEFSVAGLTDADPGANTVSDNAATGTLTGVTASATDADATNNTVTYSLINDAGGRFQINTVTGVITVANGTLLNSAVNSSHTVFVQANSSDGSSTSTGFVISVTGANTAPVLTSSTSPVIPENTLIVQTLTGLDADSDTLTFAITGGTDQALFAINGSSQLHFLAAPNYESATDFDSNNIYEVEVTVQDGRGGSDTQTISVSVSDVNEFNVTAITDTDAAGETVVENAANGSTVGITALAVDNDGTNNTVTYSLDNSAGGRFTIDSASGVVTVANGTLLDREASASHSITVRATGSDGSFSTQGFSISILDLNESPVSAITDTDATADAVIENAANGTVVGITGYATDPDATNSTVTYSLSDDAGGRFTIDSVTGVVTVANGLLLDRESSAAHSITIQASSSDGSVSSQAFTISVLPANDNVPVFTSTATPSIAEGQAVIHTLTATDADLPAQTITFTISGGIDAGHFLIDGLNRLVFAGAAPDFESPLDADVNNIYEVDVTANDGNGGTTVQSLQIQVTNTNDAPVISQLHGDSQPYLQGLGTLLIDLGANALAADVDSTDFSGGLLRTSIATGGTAAEDVLSILHQGTLPGQIGFTGGNVTFGGVLIGTATGGTLGTDLTVSLNANADAAAVTALLRSLTYENIDVLDATTAVRTIRVTLDDGDGGVSVPADAMIAVTGLNQPPVFTSAASATIPENTAIVHTVTAADPNGDPLTFSIIGGADAAMLQLSGANQLSFVTAPDFEAFSDADGNNVFEVTIQADDGNGGTVLQNLSITVSPVNDNVPVIFSSGTVAATENSTTVTTITATDADQPAQTLTYTISGGDDASLFQLNSGTGVLQFVTAPDFETPADFDGNNIFEVQVTVSDGAGGIAVQNLTVNLANLAEAPIANVDSWTTTEDTALVVPASGVLANDSDPDGDALTASLVSGPNHGTISLASDGSFTYRPGLNFSGTDSFTYRAADGGLSAASAVTLTVTAINDAPVAGNRTIVHMPGAPLVIGGGGVLQWSTDSDGDTLTATVVSTTSQGTLSLGSGGNFTYLPNAGFSGTDTFTYRVNDGGASSNLGRVTVVMLPLLPPADPGGESPGSTRSDPDTMPDGIPSAAETSPTESDPMPETTEIVSTTGLPSAFSHSESTTEKASAVDDVFPSLTADEEEAALGIILSRTRPDPFTTASMDVSDVSVFLARAVGINELKPEGASDAARQGLHNSVIDDVQLTRALFLSGILDGNTGTAAHLDAFQEELDSSLIIDVSMVGSVASVGSGLTVGFLLWAARGGMLASGVLAQFPAWKLIDPTYVLENVGEEEDDSSLQDVLKEREELIRTHPRSN